MFLSERVLSMQPSATLELIAKINKMKEEGEKVISLGAGEPDFDTPEYIKNAAKRAIDDGFTHYTPAGGIKDLKEAIVKKLKRDNNLEYGVKNIVVSNGAKHSLYNLFQAVVNKGDEVLIPSPYWVSYAEMVKFAEGEPIFIETSFEENFALKVEEIAKKITKKTKAIILNSPSNPTGKVISAEELKKIGELCVKNNILIISDEIYEKMIYEGEHVSIAALSPEIKNITVIVNGVSKAYAMTGWRIGYIAAPEDIAKYIDAFQGNTTSNPNSIAQKATVEALNNEGDALVVMREEFKRRRDYMYAELSTMKMFKLAEKPAGAFYIFADIKSSGLTSQEFCKMVLDKTKVGIVPGCAFGMEGYIRFSYATSMKDIEEAMKRLRSIDN